MLYDVHQLIRFPEGLYYALGLYKSADNSTKLPHNLLLYLTFCLSILLSEPNHSSELDSLIKNKLTESLVSEVYFYRNDTDKNIKENNDDSVRKNIQFSYKKTIKKTATHIHNNATVRWVKHNLLRHFKPSRDDPKHIKLDINELAIYYSKFPEIVMLLALLENEPWVFSYKQYAAKTRAIGTLFAVNRVEIFFDTRGAVQYKKHRSCLNNPVCTASPADVFIHELLHAGIILTTNQFIKDGGMGSMFYPLIHECTVIQLEAELYQRMTAIDGIKRPRRNNHGGKYIASFCVTCIDIARVKVGGGN